MSNLTALAVIKRADALDKDRANWKTYWQDVAHYCIPRKAYITRESTSGEKLDLADVYDSTSIYAAQILAAGLHGYLTNPQSKWFNLRVPEKFMQMKEVKIWLKSVEDETFRTLNGSNFGQKINEAYLELGVIGTACVYEEEDVKDVVRFYCRPIREAMLAENEAERVDRVYRVFKLTAQQAFERWGENAGEAVKKCIEKKDFDKKIDFVHCVMPRGSRDVAKKDAKNMPYASYYIEKSKKHIVWEGGYMEFPFMCPRFRKEAGEVYGYSPAMQAYADIKTLNSMSKTILRAGEKAVDPPLVLPHDGFLLPLRTRANGLNYSLKSGANINNEIKQLPTSGNIPIGLEMEDQRREAINRAFFVDLFMLLASRKKNMTATEVTERVQEKMLLLGPSLDLLMSELLDPLITRTVSILARNGKLPKAPEVLKDQAYEIEYVSPLAKAQRASEIGSLNQLLALVGQMANAAPSILDKINGDKVVDLAADMYGVSPEIIRDDTEVQAIREERAAAQQKELEMARLQQGAMIAKDAASAKKAEAEASNSGKAKTR